MRTKLDDFDLMMAQGAGTVSLDLDPIQLVSGTYFAETWVLNESDSMTLSSKAGRSDFNFLNRRQIVFTRVQVEISGRAPIRRAVRYLFGKVRSDLHG